MKKKILCLVMLLAVTVTFLTGCVRIESVVKVNYTGDMSVYIWNLQYVGKDSEFDPSEAEYTTTDKEYMDHGYAVRYMMDDDGFAGTFMVKQHMTEFDMPIIGRNAAIERKDGKFIIDLEWNSGEDAGEIERYYTDSYVNALKEYNGEVKFSVMLPVKATAHNATYESADGKTLTWDITMCQDLPTFHVEYPDYFITVMWGTRIALGVIVLVWLIVAPICIISKERKKAAKAEEERKAEAEKKKAEEEQKEAEENKSEE